MSQASSQVEAKKFPLLSSCDGYLLESIEWPKVSQTSCGALREDSGLLSRPCRKSMASSLYNGANSRFFGFFLFLFLFLFLRCCMTCRVSLELRQGTQVASHVAPGKSSLHSSGEGEHGIALESLHKNRPQGSLKGESRGLSRVMSGNPGFPQLVTVTSGSFSGCLWEVRNTVELGGASRDFTGFGAVEEGLISSRDGNLRVPLLF